MHCKDILIRIILIIDTSQKLDVNVEVFN